MEARLSWGHLLTVGASLSLAGALDAIGVAAWLARFVTGALGAALLPPEVLIAAPDRAGGARARRDHEPGRMHRTAGARGDQAIQLGRLPQLRSGEQLARLALPRRSRPRFGCSELSGRGVRPRGPHDRRSRPLPLLAERLPHGSFVLPHAEEPSFMLDRAATFLPAIASAPPMLRTRSCPHLMLPP
jgi:hypothetical protein